MEKNRERTISQICEYLSPDLKQAIFMLLHSAYQNEAHLAQEIGCCVKTLRGWKKGKKQVPGGKHMPIILSLALAHCPEVRNLLEEGLVKTVQCLCNQLDICQEDQREEAWSKENLSLFMEELDDKNRKIFWYFRCHGHARLTELTDLISASTDMEVLCRLREGINLEAVRISGKPLLEFYESRIDRITGEKVLFNWWLSDFAKDSQFMAGIGGRPLIDLFDEEDEIVIVSDIPSLVAVNDRIKIEQRHGILSIRLDKIQ